MRLLACTAAIVILVGSACGGGTSRPGGRLGIDSQALGGSALINTDGSPAGPATDGIYPSWSATGVLAYVKRTPDGNLDIFTVGADGPPEAGASRSKRLTSDPANDAQPAWSPDGQWIAFASDPGNNQDVYKIPPDGGQAIRLTDDPAVDLVPSWSPDGKKIAFVSHRDDNHEVYVMNSDGSGQTRLTTDPERDDYPSWSPDGARIAFNSYRTGQAEIWLMNADGSDQHQVTFSQDPSFHAVWSPDGQWIAFSRSVSGPSAGATNEDVFVIKPDGSDETRVTTNPGFDNVYSWIPGGPSATP